MKRKQLLVADGVVSLGFGLFLLVLPGLGLGVLGLDLDPGRRLLAQFLGAAVAVNGIFSCCCATRERLRPGEPTCAHMCCSTS